LLPKFVELTVWPARANSLWTILFMQRKWWACSWLCFSPALAFSVCSELSMSFKHSWKAYIFFPQRLSPSHFSLDLYNIWCCSFVWSIAKSHQARHTTQTKRM
jgi:hypothetical protein